MTPRVEGGNKCPVPRWVVVVAAAVLLVSVAAMAVGAFRVGVTWDERIHAVMLDEFFTSGWYASPDWLVNGQPDAFLGKWPYYVYAPIAALVGHVFASVAGSEPWGGFSDSASAYAARHLAAGFMAVIGILAAGLTVRIITRSWRWGVLGAAALASVPMWIGHGMFNGKDLPVGTGYTVATLGLIMVLAPGYMNRGRYRFAGIASISLGLVLAVGTRPASGLPVVLTVFGLIMWMAGYALVRRRSPGWLPCLGSRALDLMIGSALGYLVLLAVYPKGFINPLTLAKESLLISGRFPVSDAVLTNGVWLTQPPPWSYLPTWFGFQLPLLVLAGCLFFITGWVALLVHLVRLRGEADWSSWVFVIPVVLQVALLPLLAIAAHSTMYNAVRQFLFVVPAICILAVLGIRWLVGLIIRLTPSWVQGLVWVLVCLGLLAPVIDSIRLFPYSYTYFNEMTAFQGVNGRWATDYWRASSQELTTLIPKTGTVTCNLPDEGELLTNCGLEAPYAPFWEERGVASDNLALNQGEFWFVRENNGDVSTPQGCELVDSLTRPLRMEQVTIGQVFRCDLGAF